MNLKLDAEEGLKSLDESDEDEIEKAAKSKGKEKDLKTTTPAATGLSGNTLLILAALVVVVLVMRRK